jgi:hypothetical protein
MIIDNQLVFANGLAITASVGSTVIDLSGGTNFSFGNAARFGEDLGIGDGGALPKIVNIIGTAPLTTDSGTLQVQFQTSTDSATWSTSIETPAIAAGLLTAGASFGKMDWPHRLVGAALPRYVRLNYVVGTGHFTTGTVFSAIVLQRDDWPAGQYPANYTVA